MSSHEEFEEQSSNIRNTSSSFPQTQVSVQLYIRNVWNGESFLTTIISSDLLTDWFLLDLRFVCDWVLIGLWLGFHWCDWFHIDLRWFLIDLTGLHWLSKWFWIWLATYGSVIRFPIDLWLVSHGSLIRFWGFCLSKKEEKESSLPADWLVEILKNNTVQWKIVTRPPLSSYITSCGETSSLVE